MTILLMTEINIKDIITNLYPTVDDNTINIVLENADIVSYSKGSILIKEQERHHYAYFLIEGAVKSFYLKDEKEICTWFGFEKDLIGTTNIFDGLPSNETIQLMEDATLIRFKIKKLKEISYQDLSVSLIINDILTAEVRYLEDRLYQTQFMTSKERYKRLLEKEPHLLQRVSLTEIASFLGISRETLSRIRAKVSL